MDPVSLLVGAALLGAGMLLGRLFPRRRRAGETPQLPPVCGCGHDRAFHDQEGRCHAVERTEKKDIFGHTSGWLEAACTCRRYNGPIPLTTYYAPELTDDA